MFLVVEKLDFRKDSKRISVSTQKVSQYWFTLVTRIQGNLPQTHRKKFSCPSKSTDKEEKKRRRKQEVKDLGAESPLRSQHLTKFGSHKSLKN